MFALRMPLRGEQREGSGSVHSRGGLLQLMEVLFNSIGLGCASLGAQGFCLTGQRLCERGTLVAVGPFQQGYRIAIARLRLCRLSELVI